MGHVYLARQKGVAEFERLVVVKRIHRHYAKDPDFRAMLLAEGRLSSHVRHPNAVGALEVGVDDDELFLVFEYVEAASLSAIVKAARAQGKTLPAPIVSRIVGDVLAGLHAAHVARDVRGASLGIIHRDVSPQNVIVGTDGSSRLIDFGVAKAKSHLGTTREGVLKGKLSYMSPEQLLRKSVDHRSDLFACGSVLFEALTGKRLFSSDDEGAIAVAIMLGAEDTLEELGAGLPEAVRPVLARALTTRPEDRFANASDFHEALEAAIPPAKPREVAAIVEEYAGKAIESTRVRIRETAAALDEGRLVDAPANAEHVEEVDPTLVIEEPKTSRRRVFTYAALGVAAIVVIVGASVIGGRHSSSTAPASEPSAFAGTPLSPSVAAEVASSVAPPIDLDAPVTPVTTPIKDDRGHSRVHRPVKASKPPASATLHKSPYDTP